jgi:hypothetical protein
MVRKGSSVRVRQRACGKGQLTAMDSLRPREAQAEEVSVNPLELEPDETLKLSGEASPPEGKGDEPVRWWEWPLVVLALPLVYTRQGLRWMERQLRRFGTWLDHVLDVPVTWLGEQVERIAEWVSRPFRWTAARLQRPIAWVTRQLVAFGLWLAHVPPRVWHLIEVVAHALINWAAPGLLVPWRQLVRIAALLIEVWWQVADWASAPARLLWRRIRPSLARAARFVGRIVQRCAALLAVPPRFVIDQLRRPMKAPAQVMRKLSGGLTRSWRRAAQRLTALRLRAARKAAHLGRVLGRS